MHLLRNTITYSLKIKWEHYVNNRLQTYFTQGAQMVEVCSAKKYILYRNLGVVMEDLSVQVNREYFDSYHSVALFAVLQWNSKISLNTSLICIPSYSATRFDPNSVHHQAFDKNNIESKRSYYIIHLIPDNLHSFCSGVLILIWTHCSSNCVS